MSDDSGKERDRDAILARRRRFLTVALATAGIVTSCDKKPQVCLNMVEVPEPTNEPTAEPTVSLSAEPSSTADAGTSPDAGAEPSASASAETSTTPPPPRPKVCLRYIPPPKPRVCLSKRKPDDE